MRVVLQRVNHAAVSIDGETVGQIKKGYLLLVGLAPDDNDDQLDWMVHKIVNLRVFEDENGKVWKLISDEEITTDISKNLHEMFNDINKNVIYYI